MRHSFDKKRTRVLLVIDGILFGGGARVFLQLAKGLINRSYKVFVACVPDGELAPLLLEAGIEILPVDFKSKNTLRIIWQTYRQLRAHSIDIVNSQGGRADFHIRIAAKLAKVNGIISTVAMLVEGYDVTPFKRAIYVVMDRWTERFVGRFIVVSEALRKSLISNHRIQHDKIVTIYNGVELKEYQPSDSGESFPKLREEYKIEDGMFLIGAVGRLVWQKGFEYLIQAAKEISSCSPKVKMLIVGDGPLRGELHELASNLGVGDKVIFTGFRDDIKEVLSSIDLLVVSSLLEGFPMVTLEAMAMAKPIVATNINGIIEQISDGEEGLLVPPKNPEALAAAVVRLIQDKSLAAKIGMAARNKVKTHLSVEKMVTETEEVYLSFLKAG